MNPEKREVKKWTGLGVVFGLLWLFAVFFSYFLVHKPFTPEQAIRVFSIVLDLLLFVVILFVGAGLGIRVLRLAGLDLASGLERLVYGSGLGLGLLSLGVLALGGVGLLYWWAGFGLLAVTGFLARWEVYDLGRWSLARTKGWIRGGVREWNWRAVAMIYVIAIAIMTLGRALLPPTAWDALVYHLETGRIYFAAHRIGYIDGHFYANLPQLVEMLYLLGLLFKGDVVAQLMHFGFGTLLGLAVYASGRRLFTGRAALWAMLLYISVPLVTGLSGWPYVDLALSFMLFCSLTAVLRWQEEGNKKWLWLSAIYMGLGLGVKYTAAVWLFSLVAMVLLVLGRREGWRRAIWTTVKFGLLVGAIAWPFYLKSLILAGNPFYPFLFGGKEWNAIRDAGINWYSLGTDPLPYLLLPWNMTINGVGGASTFDGTVGPALLALVPLLALIGLTGAKRRYLLYVVGFQLVWQAAGAYFVSPIMLQTRMVLAVFPVLCLLAGDVLDRLGKVDLSGFSLQRFAYLVVGIVLLLNLWAEGEQFVALGGTGYLVGRDGRQTYLTRSLGDYYRMAAYVNEKLPAEATVALWWEPRGYYFRRPVLADPTLDALPQLVLQTNGDAEAVAVLLRQRGVRYLVISEWEIKFLKGQPQFPLSEEDLAVLDLLRQRHLKLIHDEGGIYSLFEVY